ncbi:MAG: hypothetical protein ACR2PJ_00180 [Pseudomonadales bacterium]
MNNRNTLLAYWPVDPEEGYSAWSIPSGPNVLTAMNPPRQILVSVSAALH